MKRKMTAGETATTATSLNNLVEDVKIAEELVSETIREDTSLDIWRDVEGFEGRYEVSFLGYLRFADKPDKRLVKCTKYGDYLRASLQHKGDLKSLKNIAVHILVAKAFVPNPEGYTFVRHKNGKLHDNRADNLEWVETKPEKKKKRKSKRTSKTVSALPILEVSDSEVLEGNVLENDVLGCDVPVGYVPDSEVAEVKVSDDDSLAGDVSSDVVEGELWMDVMGFEGLYRISNNGNLVSCKRKKTRYIKAVTDTRGSRYGLKYGLTDKDGKQHTKMAHTLVAEHFIPNPYGYEYVMHIDGNSKNNKVDNLKWTDRCVKHRMKGSESYKELEGKHNLMTTQEVEQYCIDGTYINTFKSISEAAKKTKFSYTSIRRVLNGTEPSVGGYVWKYSGNVYQTHLNRTIVKEDISKVSLPNWIHKVDKFITYFNATANKVTNVVKSFFGNFQYASLIPW